MPLLNIPYTPKESRILGHVLRPLIKFYIFSLTKGIWISITEAVTDTGADISILPRTIGEMIVSDVANGQYIEIKGVVPNAVLIGFVHELKLKVNEKEFITKVVIADSNDVPPILGRFKALDLFDVNFKKGREIEIGE